MTAAQPADMADMADSDQIFVRSAESDETAIWRSHRDAAAKESSRYRGEAWSPATSSGGSASKSEPSVVLVAGVGSTVFGSVAATEGVRGQWWIEHVFVEEPAREVGLGDALMNALVEEVRARGGVRLGSSAQPGDRSLKNLFERHGLVARTILVGRDLD